MWVRWYMPVTEDRAWSGATAAARFLVFGLLLHGCTVSAGPVQCSGNQWRGPCQRHASAQLGASPECAHGSGSSRWLLTLVQPQSSELAARVVSGDPKGAGRGSGQGLRRLAPGNVHNCGAEAGEICRVAWQLCSPSVVRLLCLSVDQVTVNHTPAAWLLLIGPAFFLPCF